MKKLFIISSILLGVVLVFLGVYNFAFKVSTPVVKKENIQKENISSVVMKTEKITAISDSAVIGAVFDKKTEEIKYYDLVNGLVWKTDSVGHNKQQITNTKVIGLKSVLWSNDHNKVLTVTQKDGQNSFFMYDYQTQKGTILKNNLDTVVWDNIGAKIFYKYFDSVSGKRTLNISNPDGSNWQKVADIETRNLNISPIPLTSLVSYWNSPDSKEETHLQIIGATGGESKSILSGKYGADYLWSPDGSKAIVSSLSNRDSTVVMLGIVTIDGKFQDLNIPTMASKCAWSQDGKTLYYALPGGIPTNAIMPNDYQLNKFKTDDTFWKVDTTTGEKNRIIDTADINGKYDASSMFLSTTESALYFINKVDQKLYRIEL